MSKSHCKKKKKKKGMGPGRVVMATPGNALQVLLRAAALVPRTHFPSSLLLTPKQSFLTSPGLTSVSRLSQLEVDLVLLEATPNGCYLCPPATMTRSPAFSLLCIPHSTSPCSHLHSQLCCSWTIISPLNIKFINFFS